MSVLAKGVLAVAAGAFIYGVLAGPVLTWVGVAAILVILAAVLDQPGPT